MPFIISSTFTLPTVLSFPTNTNFSGLSVGHIVDNGDQYEDENEEEDEDEDEHD